MRFSSFPLSSSHFIIIIGYFLLTVCLLKTNEIVHYLLDVSERAIDDCYGTRFDKVVATFMLTVIYLIRLGQSIFYFLVIRS